MSYSSPPSEVDVVIVGGGASATVLASVLARARPDLEILMLERGKCISHEEIVCQPGKHRENLIGNVRWIEADDGKDGRRVKVATRECHKMTKDTSDWFLACALGGGGTVGYMEYRRPSIEEWSSWGEGWNGEDMMDHYKKLEKASLETFDEDIHGKSGPLEVSFGTREPALAEEFLIEAIDCGLPHMDDLNDGTNTPGCSYLPKWITSQTVLRSDPTNALLLPLNPQISSSWSRLETPSLKSNLHIVTEAEVLQLHMDEENIVRSVTFEFAGIKKEARARKLIVLSAGALESPRLLLESGIGPQSVLGKKCRVDVAGVGQGLMMQQALSTAYHTSSVDTMDAFFRKEPYVLETCKSEFESELTGWLSTNGIDAGCRIQPPDSTDVTLSLTFTSSYTGLHSPQLPGNYYSLSLLHSLSASRGSITSTALHVPTPTQEDIALLSWAYKFSRSIARSMPSSLGEYAPSHPIFNPSSPVRAEGKRRPTITVVSKLTGLEKGGRSRFADWNTLEKSEVLDECLQYVVEDNEAIENWIKENVQYQDPTGTCSMKPREMNGVVDYKLNVYGIRNLKVADLSIVPKPLSGRLYTTALMIGSRAASIIIAELA